MKEFRLGKGTTEHYNSFTDLAADWGCKPYTKRTKDVNRLQKQREKFVNKHKCRTCGMPMSFITGTNLMTCMNPECKGIKIETEDKEGNKVVRYYVSYDQLDDTGAEIASTIFSED